ncbi:hypothetical protein HDU87_008468 [Geranomyces variabilis]|uniref:Adenosine deaminase domain-containing protein n=1 Tax=Geranomyces variabilis TaxID=109894 RepID=A0AAD5TRE2_9FUNG|nr:hypothetical protein HDU87_008468 [Geranomyces variabilis]
MSRLPLGPPTVTQVDRQVIELNDLKVKLFRKLDEAITGKQLVDLHTHLLGMGSADFWLYRIMGTYLPRVCELPPRADPFAKTERNKLDSNITKLLKFQLAARILKKDWTSFLEGDEIVIPIHWDAKLAKKLPSERITQLQTSFTDDVVYRADFLLTVFGLASSTDAQDEFLVALQTGKLRDMLCNANHPTVFQTYFRHYIIFNARKAEFEFVLGLPNTALLQLMEFPTIGQPDKRDKSGKPSSQALAIRALVQNGFSMLENNGSQAGPTGLNNYRGRFTPEFYPKRFRLKDSIYGQRLEVLSILINQVASRYGKSGVSLVEFSLGANDLLSVNVVKHLTVASVFTKGKQPVCDLVIDDDIGWADKNESPQERNEVYGTDGGETAPEPSRKRCRNSAGQASVHSSSAVGRQDPVDELSSEEEEFEVSSEQEESEVSEEVFEELSSEQEDSKNPDLRGTPKNSRSFLASKSDVRGPSWRKHLGAYNEKPRGFTYYFLAAFNRGGLHLPNLDEEPAYLELFSRDGPVTKLEKLMLTVSDENKPLRHFWRDYVVGLDWVGDELGHPFCALKHSIATSTVKMMRKRGRSRFGMRLHAAESVPHPWSSNLHEGFMDDMFMNHMKILRSDIKFIHAQIEHKHLRIGHGIAFLHVQQGRARRELRRRGIVCELNMTSNRYLLPMLYSNNPEHQGPAGSCMTLHRFLNDPDLQSLVCLATDDDGIWPIRKCDLHYHHVSVAGEICRAIDTGCFKSEVELENLVSLAQSSAFS